jgi:hypothetical protein
MEVMKNIIFCHIALFSVEEVMGLTTSTFRWKVGQAIRVLDDPLSLFGPPCLRIKDAILKYSAFSVSVSSQNSIIIFMLFFILLKFLELSLGRVFSE